MKPLVVLTHRVHADAVELLLTVCDVALINTRGAYARQELHDLSRSASGLLAATPERIDAGLLAGCQHLRVLACTFRIPEHIDIAACTRRGIWVTNVMSRWLGKEAEIEAARNILDVISGDPPRGALNEVMYEVMSNAA
jgi:phosphoglycerate dehydrogenase-like enzyme